MRGSYKKGLSQGAGTLHTRKTTDVIAGLGPAIHSSANAGASGAMDRGNECRDDNEEREKPHNIRDFGSAALVSINSVSAQTSASTRSGLLPRTKPSAPNALI